MRGLALRLHTDGLVGGIARRLVASFEELTALDSAIGDADHGLNMKRGATALLDINARLRALPSSDAVYAIGQSMAMSVGGASGPLYGTFFMSFSSGFAEEFELNDFARQFNRGVSAVERLGRVRAGQKTLVDVLRPVSDHLASGTATRQTVRMIASSSAESTVALLAQKGRAAYLGERSRGHMDPGARSCVLVLEAMADSLEGLQ
jgi:phosphoenolpyruvate---glycerone phosphotransferase subunit DhaL